MMMTPTVMTTKKAPVVMIEKATDCLTEIFLEICDTFFKLLEHSSLIDMITLMRTSFPPINRHIYWKSYQPGLCGNLTVCNTRG